jgi:DNA-binding XRE family transcriptional regulator
MSKEMGVEYEKTRVCITLRAARISSGYSAEEAAECVKISTETLDGYERDAGEMPLQMAIILLRMYRFPFSIIHFGNESEFIKSRRNTISELI